MQVSMQVIVPKKFLSDPKRFVRAVENTLDGAALDVKADFGATTRTWKERPVFYIRSKPGERFIGTDFMVYKWVSDGTRKHLIVAKAGRRLAFYATGFRAKTRPRMIGSNQGRAANSNFVRPLVVHHPGTTAREFPLVIREKYDKLLPKIMQRAIDAEC